MGGGGRMLLLYYVARVLGVSSAVASIDDACALAASSTPAQLSAFLAAHPGPEVHAACPEAATFLGVSLMREGDLAGGAAHLEAVARAAVPALSWPALAYLGAALELAARELFASGKQHVPALLAAASRFARSAEGRAAWEAAGRPHPALARAAQPPAMLFRSWGQVLLWAGDEDGARSVFQAGVDAGFGWVTPWARPTLPLAPLGGAPRPFYDAATAPALAPTLRALEAAAPALAAEFAALLRRKARAGGALAREAAGLHEPGAEGGFWGVHVLAVDGAAAPGCAEAPAACALLAALPLTNATRSGQAKFSVLRPGTRIRPHAGPTNARLRIHLCLRELAAGPAAATLRVGGEARNWRAGQAFAFDESFEHEVLTEAAAAVAPGGSARAAAAGVGGEEEEEDLRIVLIVDVPNPFLEELQDFVSHGVSDDGWARHEEALRAVFSAARGPPAAAESGG